MQRHFSQIIDVPPISHNVYSTVQQEVDLGVQALKRENGDMAVTLFQSALHKLTDEQPFYDHLVHNLLLSYKLVIEQLLAAGDVPTAFDLLRLALNLEIRGRMSHDSEFRKRFAGAFQDLGLVFFRHKHHEASTMCCRRAIAIYRAPGSHINLSNSLAMGGERAELADFTTEITREQLGTHIFIACVPKSGIDFLKESARQPDRL